MDPEERILVVPADDFHRLGYFQGFCRDIKKYTEDLLSPKCVRFCRRGDAENDPSLKQLIPYMIFSWKDPQGKLFLFAYTRGKGMGEARLHQKMSIGVGGHLNDQDHHDSAQSASFRDLYREGMMREFHEEVRVGSQYTEECVGLINDDSNEVGKVHLGIVHRFEMKEAKLDPNEPDLLQSGFYSVEELLALPEERFESWSWITLNALFRNP
ncbi:MAG: phosphoesterase [Planctomycetia bacterium]|nr:phosphoesterase [Planctomycetia bacterium]